jgi:hydrogenase nickel incorporation protein HypA/HybF
MHELRIAMEIISIVEKEKARRKMDNVTEIGLRIGLLSGVDPDALSFSFEAAVADTALAKTRLSIEQIPVHAICNSCSRDFDVEEYVFICPACGSTDVNVTQGEELDIAWLSSS